MVVRLRAIGVSRRDHETVQDSRIIQGSTVDDVVRIVAVVARRADVAAQRGDVRFPVAVGQNGIARCRKTTQDGYAVFHIERNTPVGTGGGFVGTGCHPYLVARSSRLQGFRKGLVGRGPGVAGVGIAAAGFYVPGGRRELCCAKQAEK